MRLNGVGRSEEWGAKEPHITQIRDNCASWSRRDSARSHGGRYLEAVLMGRYEGLMKLAVGEVK